MLAFLLFLCMYINCTNYIKKQEHQPHQNKLNFANQKFAQIMRLTFSGGLSPRLLPVQHILLHRPLEAQACL